VELTGHASGYFPIPVDTPLSDTLVRIYQHIHCPIHWNDVCDFCSKQTHCRTYYFLQRLKSFKDILCFNPSSNSFSDSREAERGWPSVN
jgi:hypothetical protein